MPGTERPLHRRLHGRGGEARARRAQARRRGRAGERPLLSRARRRTTRSSPRRSPSTAKSMSATPSPRRTGRMPRSTPSPICCRLMPGCLMMAEITALGDALENPERPVMAIVGGAKVSTKIEVLTHLVARMDVLVVGGGMANTFLLAQGRRDRRLLLRARFRADRARRSWRAPNRPAARSCLPTDAVVAKELKEGVAWSVCPVGDVPADAMILDFGPDSVADLKRRLGGDPDRAVERPARRLRDRALRRGDLRARPRGGAADQGGQARERGRRRRYRAGA